jgi:hypothetical protein
MGDYDSAQLHANALKRMVDARGGLCAFAHNDGLVRGIAWYFSSLLTASISHLTCTQQARLPHGHRISHTNLLPAHTSRHGLPTAA